MTGVHSEIPTTNQEIQEYIDSLLKTPSVSQLVQTSLQPTVFRCLNPDCSEHPKKLRPYDFQSDYPVCPKCGAVEPLVQKRALIHFLFHHPKGKITGNLGRPMLLACDHDRDFIATTTNGEAGTGDFAAVNCPGCWKFIEEQFRGHKLYEQIMKLRDKALLLNQKQTLVKE